MHAAETWKHIHTERADMADTLAELTAEQWAAPSWCGRWTVQMTAAHILVAAEQTPARFYGQMLRAGLRFNVYAERTARHLAVLAPSDLIARLRARTTTTNRPPAPAIAMLGEIVTHGGDIRMALRLEHRPDDAALIAVAENYSRTNLLIGAKKRIRGLRLTATDADWSTGNGQEVTGPLLSLIMAMSGRHQACSSLSGEGVSAMTFHS
jgi:uncharacterized protein (TIGR03083 family)